MKILDKIRVFLMADRALKSAAKTPYWTQRGCVHELVWNKRHYVTIVPAGGDKHNGNLDADVKQDWTITIWLLHRRIVRIAKNCTLDEAKASVCDLKPTSKLMLFVREHAKQEEIAHEN